MDVRRSEESQIVARLEAGFACRVGSYICAWNRGNYEIRSSWHPGRVFRTSSVEVAKEMLLHMRWREPGPTAV